MLHQSVVVFHHKGAKEHKEAKINAKLDRSATPLVDKSIGNKSMPAEAGLEHGISRL